MSTLTVQIVTWNSAEVLRPLLVSLRDQTMRDFQLLVIDNASTDGIESLLASEVPSAAFVRMTANLGYAGAHNIGFRMAETDSIAVLNPDTVLAPDALALLVRALDSDPSLGSVSPKLLKDSLTSGIIDAAGLAATPARRFLNRGEGQRDHGQFDEARYVFGATGACAAFRRSALETVRVAGEYFDETFFAYKEDVDLSWRLLLAGWKHWYEPRARVAHLRRAQHEPLVARWRSKKGYRINRLSYRNHLLLLIKNERIRNLFFPLPRAAIYEMAKFFYLLVREPKTLTALIDVLRVLPKMMRKRALALRHQRMSPAELRTYFRGV